MKASGSGRMPENFCKAASTSRVAASPSGSSPCGQRLGLLAPLAAGHVGDELEQHVGRGAERHVIGQHLAQRPSGDRKVRRRIERRDHGIDQRRIVGRIDAEAVADRRSRARCLQRSNSMCQVSFCRPVLVEARARYEASRRPDCRANSRAPRRRLRRRGIALRLGVPRRWRVPSSSIELLQHAGGFLAARHAEIQPLFLLDEDRSRIVLAVVAALAAILLRHRRHHAARQRLPSASFMRSASGMRRVVPRRAVVIFGGRSPALHARAQAADLPARDSGVTPAVQRYSPANKPLSQARCSGVNGAFSGRNDGIGGRGVSSCRRLRCEQGLERVDRRAGARRRGSFLAAKRGARDRL